MVIAITAGLVDVTPPRDTQAGPFSTTLAFGSGSMDVVLDPARPGPTALHLYLLDGAGRPVDHGDQGMTLALNLPAEDVGPLDRRPHLVGRGHYQLDGRDFSLPVRWSVTVRARSGRFEEVAAVVEIPVH